jgi:UrcA family protein
MRTILLGALALATFAASAATADPGHAAVQPPATTIRVGDLDLTDARDARLMFARIRNASAKVCRDSPGAGGTDIASILAYDVCFRDSVRRAVTELDAPLVTAAFDAKGGSQKFARLP